MTQQFESWADARGLDELSSEYSWAEKAWQAAQAAQPVEFQQAAEHVTELGNTTRSYTSGDWTMVHKDRYTDLLVIEEALRKELERVRGERDAMAQKLANMERTDGNYTHRCRDCAHPYTSKAGQSEDCPACGSDGRTGAAQGASHG